MKHLKLFESKNKIWIVDYYLKDGNDHNFTFFWTEKDAKDYIIDIINDERDQLQSSLDEEYTDSMYFTEYRKAMDWYNSNFNDIDIILGSGEVSNYNPSEKLVKMREIRKFNL